MFIKIVVSSMVFVHVEIIMMSNLYQNTVSKVFQQNIQMNSLFQIWIQLTCIIRDNKVR